MQFDTVLGHIVKAAVSGIFVISFVGQAEPAKNLYPVHLHGKRGYIDQHGQIVIQPKFDDVYSFQNDITAVKVDSKWGTSTHQVITSWNRDSTTLAISLSVLPR